ncbi:hypothetical protein [Streptomyces sp. NBC_01530]|uniref:hypothetical protein n=1 Tax=Streptomyces sp. NBC_01530 TaxID=2903895 RepID=UPI0038689757
MQARPKRIHGVRAPARIRPMTHLALRMCARYQLITDKPASIHESQASMVAP